MKSPYEKQARPTVFYSTKRWDTFKVKYIREKADRTIISEHENIWILIYKNKKWGIVPIKSKIDQLPIRFVQ